MKLLYGIQAEDTNFMDNKWTHLKIAKSIWWHARRHNFDGIFLDLDSELLLNNNFEHFLNALSEVFVEEDKIVYSTLKSMDMVLAVSARWIPNIYHRLPHFENYFKSFYLWSDETITSTDLYSSAYVDPLSSTIKVNKEDTIKGAAGLLFKKIYNLI